MPGQPLPAVPENGVPAAPPPPASNRSTAKLGLIAVVLGIAIGVGYAVVSTARRPEAPTSYAPLPWSEGQWRRHRIVERDGRATVTRIAIASRGPDGFWVEQEHTLPSGRSDRAKVLFAEQPSTAEQALDAARAVEIQTADGRTIHWTAADDARTDDVVQAVAAVVVSTAGLVETTPGPLQDVTVSAGSFRQCMRADATIAAGGAGKLMTGWFHPSVPLGGLVQGRTTDGESTMELIEFGVQAGR